MHINTNPSDVCSVKLQELGRFPCSFRCRSVWNRKLVAVRVVALATNVWDCGLRWGREGMSGLRALHDVAWWQSGISNWSHHSCQYWPGLDQTLRSIASWVFARRSVVALAKKNDAFQSFMDPSGIRWQRRGAREAPAPKDSPNFLWPPLLSSNEFQSGTFTTVLHATSSFNYVSAICAGRNHVELRDRRHATSLADRAWCRSGNVKKMAHPCRSRCELWSNCFFFSPWLRDVHCPSKCVFLRVERR